MKKEITCIICPNGCTIEVRTDERNHIVSIEHALCQKGKTYVSQELVNPQRTIATSIFVEGGALPLASVRLSKAIPRAKIFDAMAEIKKVKVRAPVTAGTTVIQHILGYDSDVIITKNIPATV